MASLDTSEITPRNSNFQFTPLEHKDSIRLLVLEPAKGVEENLTAALEHVQLGDKPIFSAISYTWGKPEFPEQINFPGGKLAITENLSKALRRFRSKDGPRR